MVEITQVVEVSLNSVVGLTTPKTMKLKGMIGEQEVVVPIDPGATHNFISLELVKRMQLPIAKTEAYGVAMGTGNAERGEGICRGVTLHLQGIDIVEEFLPLGLGSETVTLCGDPSLGKTLVSLKALMRTIKHEGAGILVELSQLVGLGEESPRVPKFLHQTLAEHEAVVDMPSGLPPVRGHEHSIVLKEGSQPISVRPYLYPHIQKDEIERLIKEMLAAGIIQAFEDTELPNLKEEKPGLTHTQYKDMIWKLWKKSPDNPLNQFLLCLKCLFISFVNNIAESEFSAGSFRRFLKNQFSIMTVDILKTTMVGKLPNDLEGIEASMECLLALIDDVYKYVDDVVDHLLLLYLSSITRTQLGLAEKLNTAAQILIPQGCRQVHLGKSKGFWKTISEGTWSEAFDGLGISLLLTSNPAIQVGLKISSNDSTVTVWPGDLTPDASVVRSVLLDLHLINHMVHYQQETFELQVSLLLQILERLLLLSRGREGTEKVIVRFGSEIGFKALNLSRISNFATLLDFSKVRLWLLLESVLWLLNVPNVAVVTMAWAWFCLPISQSNVFAAMFKMKGKGTSAIQIE
ncbi:hypothetical protein HHK36_010404 [Tetracentron sinense]|uniref:Coiled-coil domain-containing protein n=1 Tax=Tetracentron sinense TaxID=13715 RepID=A0A835DMC4_TETSI|nr:hypothetical protein HHK36_010404 [Tetracentron sinense]